MIPWIYRWLPIFFGCHCRDDRSFHYHGKRFPLCARCTGELVGILLGFLTCFFFIPPWWANAVLMLPLIVDGSVQRLSRYESTNPRRVITGLLFGYALCGMFLLLVCSGFRLGYSLTA